MADDEELNFYRERLMHIGAQIIKMSDDDTYIERLASGENLLPIDHALRSFVSKLWKVKSCKLQRFSEH